jgi:hypothetical protein
VNEQDRTSATVLKRVVQKEQRDEREDFLRKPRRLMKPRRVFGRAELSEGAPS